jgi:hypothetical protein
MKRTPKLPDVILKTPAGPVELGLDTDEHAADVIELQGGHMLSDKWISSPPECPKLASLSPSSVGAAVMTGSS